MDTSERTKLSKKLTYLLRHGAEENGLAIQSDGFIQVLHILRLPGYRGMSLPKIQEIVQKCEKQRFELKHENDIWFIRASQGHTMKSINDEELLTPINENDHVQFCIHGTYQESLPSIRANGLNKMKRNHIHFAESLPGKNGVISGMRSSCTAIVVVDLKAALRDGIKFYRSTNNVILSPGIGDTGTIPSQYFTEILLRDRNREFVPIEKQDTASSVSSPTTATASASNERPPVPVTKSRVQHLPTTPSPDSSIRDLKPSSSDPPSAAAAPLPAVAAMSWSQHLQSTVTLESLPPPIPSSTQAHRSYFSDPSPAVDYFCVVDFEATCLNNVKISPQEIIEFPAIMINARTMATVESELGHGHGVFHSYVKPIHHPILSDFCTDLTGIEQETVDKAPTFPTVYQQFLRFLQPFTRSPIPLTSATEPLPPTAYSSTHYQNIIFISHGNFDFQTALKSQCHLSSLKTIVKSWINVKDVYQELEKRNPLFLEDTGTGTAVSGTSNGKKGSKKQRTPARRRGLGMAAMLDNLNLQLIGRHHSGIDDSRNIARIFLELARRGGNLTLYTFQDTKMSR
jgi:2'-phosphotransferase